MTASRQTRTASSSGRQESWKQGMVMASRSTVGMILSMMELSQRMVDVAATTLA